MKKMSYSVVLNMCVLFIITAPKKTSFVFGHVSGMFWGGLGTSLGGCSGVFGRFLGGV